MKHLYWSSWSVLKVTIIQYMLCDYIVCIEIGGADDDERKELINSLSGSHDVHLDDNPQGTAWVTRGCGSGATTDSPTFVCTVQVFTVQVSAYRVPDNARCMNLCQVWISVLLYLLVVTALYSLAMHCKPSLEQNWSTLLRLQLFCKQNYLRVFGTTVSQL